MKYNCTVEIAAPLGRVVELFDDPKRLKEWQPGLLSFEAISGRPGQPGAKSRLKYRMGKREIEMIETITVRSLPQEFSGTYETKGVFNIVKNRFSALGPNLTRYETENEFQFTGLFMKLIGLLMPGAFRKETGKIMERFKEFAERG